MTGPPGRLADTEALPFRALAESALPTAGPARPLADETSAPVVGAMTIDVEDYFQVSAFAGQVPADSWDRHPSRVERNTDAVLRMLAAQGVAATFFTLGWVAERFPKLIRRITTAGHELASHGYAHIRVDAQSPQAFRDDIARTKDILEQVSGTRVRGYRAASFSISERTQWAYEVLAEEGYAYSSSVYPIRHDHYGSPDAPRFPFRPNPGGGLLEIPLTTLPWGRRTWPVAGGGYFRLLPYRFSRWALRRVSQRERRPCVFYFHPWEIDPDQPRIPGISAKARFRHYLHLRRMQGKLHAVLGDLPWGRMDQVFLGGGGRPS